MVDLSGIKLSGKKIDLGGGEFPRQGFLNIDNSTVNPINGHSYTPDIIHDLNEGIPFPDNFIDEVSSSHNLEHLKDPVFCLKEIVRVCKNGSKVTIIVPVHDLAPPYHLTDMSREWFLTNCPKELKLISTISREKSVVDPVIGDRVFTELEVHYEVRK